MKSRCPRELSFDAIAIFEEIWYKYKYIINIYYNFLRKQFNSLYKGL